MSTYFQDHGIERLGGDEHFVAGAEIFHFVGGGNHFDDGIGVQYAYDKNNIGGNYFDDLSRYLKLSADLFPVENFRWPAHPLDLSFFKTDHFIGQTKDLRKIMADENGCQLILPVNLQDIVLQLVAHLIVQCG